MKSMLAVLPLVGLAIAKEPCTQKTYTVTATNTITFTVPARPATATPADVESVITSTIDLTTTIWVTAPSPVAPTPYYPMPNGTYNHTVEAPSTPSVVTLIVTPSPVEPEPTAPMSYSSVPAAPSEPVAAPTSEAAAAPVSSVTPIASGTPVNPGDSPATTGEATFYGGNVAGGMCSFTGYTIPSGIFGTALSDSNWEGAGNCGACISVTGPDGNSIKAMVVDQCPDCGPGHLDLFPDAFAKLADPSKGVIPTTWSVVPCDITSPIILKNKEGTSPYWFSMQVMNSNVPVSKLEVSTDGGNTWQATTRQPYNFFENSSGFGTDSVDVKVTSSNGDTIVVKGVSIAASTTKTAASNF